MSESDDIESIRERRREELRQQGAGGRPGDGQSDTAPDEPIHIEGQDHLESVTSQYGVVLVDLYADWCGPCQMLEPTVRELAMETAAAVAKVDVDKHQSLAQQLGVQGVPTLLLYADGEPVKRLVGVQDKGTLLGLVERFA